MAKRNDKENHRRILVKRRMAQRVEWLVLLLLLIISVAHLLRLVSGTELLVGGMQIPLWVSLFGCLGPATLLGLFWWSHH